MIHHSRLNSAGNSNYGKKRAVKIKPAKRSRDHSAKKNVQLKNRKTLTRPRKNYGRDRVVEIKTTYGAGTPIDNEIFNEAERIEEPETESKNRSDSAEKTRYGRPGLALLDLWLNDGRAVRNLRELSKAFETMNGRVFTEHREKNDISEWIKDIIGDAELAAEFATAQNRRSAIRILEKHAHKKKNADSGSETEETHRISLKEAYKKIPDAAEDAGQEFHDMQEAIKEIARMPMPGNAGLSIRERGKILAEKEKKLQNEEKRINKKKDENARKRKEIFEQRELLEKEKFERMLRTEDTAREYGRNPAGIPGIKIDLEHGERAIKERIQEARSELRNDNAEKAVRLLQEIKNAISTDRTMPGNSRKLEYEVMALEVEIKLASLHQ